MLADPVHPVALAGRTFAIATDAVILIATWSKTWSMRHGLKAMNVSMGGPRVSLSELLMRDGELKLPVDLRNYSLSRRIYRNDLLRVRCFSSLIKYRVESRACFSALLCLNIIALVLDTTPQVSPSSLYLSIDSIAHSMSLLK